MYHRAEKLVAMLALGARHPLKFMADMLEMPPPCDEKSKMFPASELLPQLRLLLTKDDVNNLVFWQSTRISCGRTNSKMVYWPLEDCFVAGMGKPGG
jgi:hypothetical protein